MCSGYLMVLILQFQVRILHDGNVDSNPFLWKFYSNKTVSCDKIRTKLRFEDLKSIVTPTRTDVTHRRNENTLHE